MSLWSNKYLFLTSFLKQEGDNYRYMCEFSRPLAGKPNPQGTVKVYFWVKFGEEESELEDQQNQVNIQIQTLLKGVQVKFRFENDSLFHNPRSSVVANMLEKWIEKYLA